MRNFLDVLAFSFSITGPIFVILALGYALRRWQVINDAFVDTGSKLVFNITLPALLFISISKTHFEEAANLPLIAFGLTATFAIYLLLEWGAKAADVPPRDRGVVVQGGFRSNMAIIGLAYCVNAYGDPGLVMASLYVGLVTILFNVLSVVTLSRSLHTAQGWTKIAAGIARNPLIIGILLALPVSWTGVPIPGVLLKSGEYFAQMTLPLALLCTGASLNFQSLRLEVASTVLAAGTKLLLVPLVFSIGGIALGFRGMELGILLLMSSAPSAAAGYVMVRAMGGNATLAANIIALTTLGSILMTSIGVTVLRGAGLM
jgi:predicted permease